MGNVVVEISPSLDGYVAGAGVSIERPFGDAGAVVIGRRMFDIGIRHRATAGLSASRSSWSPTAPRTSW